MKKKLTFLLIPLIGFCIISCQETKNERFAREAKEYTERNCPQRITADGTIVLDSMVFHGEEANEMVYYYSVNTSEEGVQQIIGQKDNLRQSMLSNIRNSVDLKHIKNAGLTLRYVYFSALTEHSILELRFTADDYN